MIPKRLIDMLISLMEKLPQNRVTEFLVVWLNAVKELFFGDPLVFHYGCPNSNKTAKLQLKKRAHIR